MERVYLGLGSNVGDSERTIRNAFLELQALLGEARLSSLWLSKPMYVEEQPDFINAVATGVTDLSPRGLLAAVHAIEASFGRDRSLERSKGPRRLDIDILLYGSRIISELDLVIPHKGLKERQFALLPLLELDRSLVDPEDGQPYSTLAATLPSQGIYLLG